MKRKNFDLGEKVCRLKVSIDNPVVKYFFLCYYTCDKQVLWESAGGFPRDNSRFSRQVAQFTCSGSSDKIFAFQPRGFVFESVRMRYFFTSIPKQKGPISTFFGTMRFPLFSALRDFFPKSFKFSKGSPLQFFDILQQYECLKNPKWSPLSDFSAL